MNKRKIILYDGVCALCNWFVLFVISIDKKGVFYFLPQDSEFARNLESQFHFALSQNESVVLVEEDLGIVTIKSDAVLRVFKEVKGIWTIVYFMRFLPQFFRNFVYDIVAAWRYKIFGKLDTCPIPPADIRGRFLS